MTDNEILSRGKIVLRRPARLNLNSLKKKKSYVVHYEQSNLKRPYTDLFIHLKKSKNF